MLNTINQSRVVYKILANGEAEEWSGRFEGKDQCFWKGSIIIQLLYNE